MGELESHAWVAGPPTNEVRGGSAWSLWLASCYTVGDDARWAMDSPQALRRARRRRTVASEPTPRVVNEDPSPQHVRHR